MTAHIRRSPVAVDRAGCLRQLTAPAPGQLIYSQSGTPQIVPIVVITDGGTGLVCARTGTTLPSIEPGTPVSIHVDLPADTAASTGTSLSLTGQVESEHWGADLGPAGPSARAAVGEALKPGPLLRIGIQDVAARRRR